MLPSAGQALLFVEKAMDEALALAEGEMRAPDGPSDPRRRRLTFRATTALRDAAMLGMSIGHVGLVLRISVVRTVKGVDEGAQVCTHPGCVKAGCFGNRVEVAAGAAADPLRYALVLPHHKNSNKGISMPRLVIKSPKLNQLLSLWQEVGRPSLIHHAQDSARRLATPEPTPPYLFLNDSGLAFASLTLWWVGLALTYSQAVSVCLFY